MRIISRKTDSNGYYTGSDGARYAKVKANPIENTYVFNDIKKAKIKKGKKYYFKVEPIKWKIEEENDETYKLISEEVLDCQMYYSLEKERIINGKKI